MPEMILGAWSEPVSELVTYISLGHRCEVAWQIRHWTGQEQSYPWDWLVSSLSGCTAMIEDDFVHLHDEDLLKVVAYGSGSGWSVLNTRYNVLLHHQFDRDRDGKIIEGWRHQIKDARSKFAHLRLRWRSLLESEGHLCFIRRFSNLEMPSERGAATSCDDYLKVIDVIKRRAPRAKISLALGDCRDLPASPHMLPFSVGRATSEDWPDPKHIWRGRSSSYQKLFREMLPPFLTRHS